MKKIPIIIFILIISIIFIRSYFLKIEYKPVEGTYISLAPSLTEIIYAIEAEDNLVAVSCCCDYPETAKEKPRAGGLFYPSDELILKLKPEIIFALEAQKHLLANVENLDVKVQYFSFKKLDDIYKSIDKIGELTNRSNEAKKLIKKLKSKEKTLKTKNPKRLLFVVHPEPIVSIGGDSFITDIIKKTGHTVITEDIKKTYPEVSVEYVFSEKPDIIIVTSESLADYIKSFIDTRFVILNAEQFAITVRPGPRIIESMEYFSSI